MRLDRIRIEVIKYIVGGSSIEDKMRAVRHRWFSHIKRSMDALVRRSERIALLVCRRVCRRGRGRHKTRPRTRLNEVIRYDLQTLRLNRRL